MSVKFSVIIPVYNVEKYISECVESVISQSYRDVEVILVDDGSADSSGKACDEFAATDERVKVVHKPNGGLVSARKAGARVACGDYIVCVDGDDYLPGNALETYASAIEEHNPDVVCSASLWKYPDGEKTVPCSAAPGRVRPRKNRERNFSLPRRKRERRVFSPSVWAKAFRRELYVNAQSSVPDDIKIGEDNACTKPIIARAQKLAVLPDCTYVYRINSASMTKNRKPFDLFTPKLVCEHLEKTLPRTADMQAQVYRCAVHYLFNAVASQYFSGDDKAAKENIKNALSDEYYLKAVKACRFKAFSKGALALFALKHKAFRLIKAYSKTR